uniref:Uncharacterized protein n=1 Tax=Anguilla anguilla TaxID=7936 RepID=A0A0E9X4I3_ANGAN
MLLKPISWKNDIQCLLGWQIKQQSQDLSQYKCCTIKLIMFLAKVFCLEISTGRSTGFFLKSRLS